MAALAREIEERAKRIHSAYEYTAEASAVQVEQCTALREALEARPTRWLTEAQDANGCWIIGEAHDNELDAVEQAAKWKGRVVPLYDLREQR